MKTGKLFVDKVKDHHDQLTASEKTVVDFIMEHKDHVSFMTAESMSEHAGVGKSTVMRVAKALGYDSFTSMRSSLQEEFVTHRLHYRIQQFNKHDDSDSALVKSVQRDISNINHLLDTIDIQDFEAVVTLIGEAKEIFTLGFRSSVADAHYLGFSLNRMLGNTLPITSTGIALDQCLKHASSDSLVFVFSFPRYTNQTIEIAKYLKENNQVKIVCITDRMKCPITPISDYCFLTAIESAIPIYSHISSMSIINALVATVAQAYRKRIHTHLANEETYTSAMNVFYM